MIRMESFVMNKMRDRGLDESLLAECQGDLQHNVRKEIAVGSLVDIILFLDGALLQKQGLVTRKFKTKMVTVSVDGVEHGYGPPFYVRNNKNEPPSWLRLS